MARTRGKQAYEGAVQEDKELLRGLGLALLSVEGGLRVTIARQVRNGRVNPWDTIQVNSKFWGWLRPLLVELRELREEKAGRTTVPAASDTGTPPVRLRLVAGAREGGA